MENTTDPVKFKANVAEKKKKFEKLLSDFETHDDPVGRYINRQRMLKLQRELEEFGINVNVP